MRHAILRSVLLLMAMVVVLPMNADIYSGYCGAEGDNIKWRLDTGMRSLVITGQGEMANYDGKAPWYNQRSSIRSVQISEGVTSIGKRAFTLCKYLPSIDIPSSVTTIGYGAFGDCASISSIHIPENVTSIGNVAFIGCTGLTSITVDSQNATYDSRDNCNAIIETATDSLIVGCKNTTIPHSVTSIGDYAFSTCSGLSSIEIPESVTSIGNYAFNGAGLTSVSIPESVTNIGDAAFSVCNSLTSVHLPESMTSISTEAFHNCPRLHSINVPDSVKFIGDNAFSYCYDLGAINIPDSVTYIGYRAFYNCLSLTKITCNAEIPPVCGYEAFYDVPSSVTLFVPDSAIEEYKENSPWNNFANIVAMSEKEDDEEGGSGEMDITDPISSGDIYAGYCGAEGDNIKWKLDTGTGILAISGQGEMANYDGKAPWYNQRSSIRSVQISEGVTSIGKRAFTLCKYLPSIDIPSSVTSIGYGAFGDCANISTIHIPENVTSIGNVAFIGCTGLTSITVDSQNATYDSRDNCNAIIETATDSLIVGCKNTTIPLSVTSIGDYAFSTCSGLSSIEIPENVTSIGNYAFNGAGLTSVSIPESVTNIGDAAFSVCNNLVSVHLPESMTSISNEAFHNCPRLHSINIPDSVKFIGDNAFSYCYDLGAINIPDSVTYIGYRAFYNCLSLTKITCNAEVPPVCGYEAFYDVPSSATLYVPDSAIEEYKVTSPWNNFANIVAMSEKEDDEEGGSGEMDITDPISSGDIYAGYCGAEGDNIKWKLDTGTGILAISGQGEMANYDGKAPWYNQHEYIRSAQISEGVTSIGDRAFTLCKYLPSIDIPSSVTSIGYGAFGDCASISSIHIPENVTSIGNAAFIGCTGLTSITVDSQNATYDSRDNCNAIIETATDSLIVGCKNTTIPLSVTSIGDYAFSTCSGLSSIEIPENVTSIGNYAFNGAGLTSVSIPESVTNIGDAAFSVCNSLTSVRLPEGLTSISTEAFHNCPRLHSINVPDSVKFIGDNAFSYCYDLRAINIPDSVTYIGYRAFYNCLSLTKITCNADVPPVCGYEAFYDVPSSATLYVPDSAIEEYKETSPWNNFANIVRLSEKEDDGIVKMVENKKEDSCYDLQGREIIHPLKGIFIKNGKKIFAP